MRSTVIIAASRVIVVASLLVGCAAPAKRAPPHAAREVGDVPSNILAADYAGSSVCARCHKDIYQAWSASPMHHMTRVASEVSGAAEAPFDGAEFHFKDDRALMETRDGERYVRIESRSFGTHSYRVTRVIGGHHREDFAGVEVAPPGSAPVANSAPHNERVLPISFMLDSRTWRYKGYSVMSPERPGLRAGGVWNRTCIFCHNTVPYLSTILGELAGPGAAPYQGEVVDRLLPAERRAPFQVTDAAALTVEIARELARLGGGGEPTVGHLIDVTRARFDAGRLVEVGIGCESCHGGSRAHADNFNLTPSFEMRSRFLRQVLPEGLSAKQQRAQRINRTCARCHQVLFSRYPFTWEGGLRARDPGGSNINSGEARDFLLGGCASAMTCVDCHDPHAPDNRARMDALDGPGGNRVCVRCHAKYDNVIALEAHSHHQAGGAGGVCMNCHLPKKNMSLDNRLTRYHRIGSPTDRARVEGDRPLECALCHADQTVGALVAKMEAWWNKRYDRAALLKLYGSLEAKPLMVALTNGRAHEQATALGVLEQIAAADAAGQARVRMLAPLIAAQLTNPYPMLRYYAQRALEAAFGEPSPVELHQDDQRIFAQAAAWLTRHGMAAVNGNGNAPPADSNDE